MSAKCSHGTMCKVLKTADEIKGKAKIDHKRPAGFSGFSPTSFISPLSQYRMAFTFVGLFLVCYFVLLLGVGHELAVENYISLPPWQTGVAK